VKLDPGRVVLRVAEAPTALRIDLIFTFADSVAALEALVAKNARTSSCQVSIVDASRVISATSTATAHS
jgi:hypothetical protein